MSKIENNRIYYDHYNEIRCDKFALEKFVKESEEKDKTIADLEAKLAESEKEVQKWKDGTMVVKLCDLEKQLAKKDAERELDNSFWKQECDSLQKALAEKEKEIEELSSMVSVFSKSSVSQLKDFIVNKPFLQLGYTKYLEDKISQANQDKISFAVAELRRLKMTLYNGTALPDISVFRVIDRQIEQLTHQHEDKGE